MTKFERLARSRRNATNIAAELIRGGVRLDPGESIYDLTNLVGRRLIKGVRIVAAFESDLIWARTDEGKAMAKEKGKLTRQEPKLSPVQERDWIELHRGGDHTSAGLVELFDVGRATTCHALERPPFDTPPALPLPQVAA